MRPDRAAVSNSRRRSGSLEHLAVSLPMSRMTRDPRGLRPEEREPIDPGGKNGLVTSALQGHEWYVVDRVPGCIHARHPRVDVAAGADADTKATVGGEVLPREGP